MRPRVKGGGRGLVTRRRPVEAAIKATDFDNLDLLPADFSYRNMDLELDDTKKRTRRLGQLLTSVADDYDIVFLDCPPSISLVSENVLHAVRHAARAADPRDPVAAHVRPADPLRGRLPRRNRPRWWRSSPWPTAASGCTAT